MRILDKFTSLTAELTARRKQYEYYRDALLSFGKVSPPLTFGLGSEEVRWMTLGEIAKFTYGFTDKAKDSGNARFIRITDINDDGLLNPDGAKYVDLSAENDKYKVKKGDLLMARTGATYGKTLFVSNDAPAIYASFLIKIELNNSLILNRFYWHFSKSTLYWEQANSLVSKAGQPQFNSNALCKVKIQVPSIAMQQRIVNVLDNFDAICSDLKIGLPAEIDARKKQYEYYRDKLLSFDTNVNNILHGGGGVIAKTK